MVVAGTITRVIIKNQLLRLRSAKVLKISTVLTDCWDDDGGDNFSFSFEADYSKGESIFLDLDLVRTLF